MNSSALNLVRMPLARALVVIFGVAFAIRLFVLLIAPTPNPMFYDARKFLSITENIIAGNGFYHLYLPVESGHVFGTIPLPGSGIQQIEPVLPAVLVPFLWLFGRENLMPFFILNAFLSSLLVVLICLITWKLTASRKASLLSGVLASIYPGFVFSMPYILREPLQMVMLAGAILLLLSPPRLWRTALAGGLLGLTALTRESSIVLVSIMCLWMLWKVLRSRRGWKHLAILPIAAALVIAPWTIRNIRVYQLNPAYEYPTLVAKLNPFTQHGLQFVFGVFNARSWLKFKEIRKLATQSWPFNVQKPKAARSKPLYPSAGISSPTRSKTDLVNNNPSPIPLEKIYFAKLNASQLEKIDRAAEARHQYISNEIAIMLSRELFPFLVSPYSTDDNFLAHLQSFGILPDEEMMLLNVLKHFRNKEEMQLTFVASKRLAVRLGSRLPALSDQELQQKVGELGLSEAGEALALQLLASWRNDLKEEKFDIDLKEKKLDKESFRAYVFSRRLLKEFQSRLGTISDVELLAWMERLEISEKEKKMILKQLATRREIHGRPASSRARSAAATLIRTLGPRLAIISESDLQARLEEMKLPPDQQKVVLEIIRKQVKLNKKIAIARIPALAQSLTKRLGPAIKTITDQELKVLVAAFALSPEEGGRFLREMKILRKKLRVQRKSDDKNLRAFSDPRPDAGPTDQKVQIVLGKLQDSLRSEVKKTLGIMYRQRRGANLVADSPSSRSRVPGLLRFFFIPYTPPLLNVWLGYNQSSLFKAILGGGLSKNEILKIAMHLPYWLILLFGCWGLLTLRNQGKALLALVIISYLGISFSHAYLLNRFFYPATFALIPLASAKFFQLLESGRPVNDAPGVSGH